MKPVDRPSSQVEYIIPSYEILWIENKSREVALPSEDELRKPLDQLPFISSEGLMLEFEYAENSPRRALLRVAKKDGQLVSPAHLQMIIQSLTFNFEVAVNKYTPLNAVSYWLEPTKENPDAFTLRNPENLKQLESELNFREEVVAGGTQIRLIPSFPLPVMHISLWNGLIPDYALIQNLITFLNTTVTRSYGALTTSGVFVAMLPESIGGGSGGSTTGTPTGGAVNPYDTRAAWRPIPTPWNFVKQRFDAPPAGLDQPVDVYVIDTIPYLTAAGVLGKLNQFAGSPTLHVQTLIQQAVANGKLVVDPVPVTANTSGLSPNVDPDARWHGLFIAGIILSLTKNTTVHLVNAADLNSGYASFPDIVDWLVAKAKGANPNPTASPTPVLVNLSLTTNPAPFRSVDATDLPQLATDLGLTLNETIALLNDSSDRKSELYDWVIGWNYARKLATSVSAASHVPMTDLTRYYATNLNRCIVASAANNRIGDEAMHLQHAGYPARLKGIVSVAALSFANRVADYTHVAKISAQALKDKIATYHPPVGGSNIYEKLATFLDAQGEGFDDDITANGVVIPRSDAFFLFGGTADLVNKNVINSLYLADIGTTQANLTGLAGWSGTSFATAVMTGVLARLCELDQNPVGAVDRALTALRTNIVPVTNRWDAGYYIYMEQY